LYSIYGPLSDVTGLTLDELNIGTPLLLSIIAPACPTRVNSAVDRTGTGYSYWAIGFGAIFFQPLALAFGKRPVFIFSALANGLINIWTVYLTGNGSWIVSRLVLGFSAGPSFCLVETAIADIVRAQYSGRDPNCKWTGY
jgi:MFS family permease